MILKFTPQNVINSFLKFLGALPKGICMEVVGMGMSACGGGGGGGIQPNIPALREQAETARGDIEDQMQQVPQFAAG